MLQQISDHARKSGSYLATTITQSSARNDDVWNLLVVEVAGAETPRPQAMPRHAIRSVGHGKGGCAHTA